MKTTKTIILLALLAVGVLGNLSPVSAQQIDASTPSHERPVVEESSFEGLNAQDQSKQNEEIEWFKWALIIVLFGLTLATGVRVYRKKPLNK